MNSACTIATGNRTGYVTYVFTATWRKPAIPGMLHVGRIGAMLLQIHRGV